MHQHPHIFRFLKLYIITSTLLLFLQIPFIMLFHVFFSSFPDFLSFPCLFCQTDKLRIFPLFSNQHHKERAKPKVLCSFWIVTMVCKSITIIAMQVPFFPFLNLFFYIFVLDPPPFYSFDLNLSIFNHTLQSPKALKLEYVPTMITMSLISICL